MITRLLRGRQTEDRDINFVIPSRGMQPQPLTGPLSVTNNSSLTIPTVYACVQLISDSIGSLPFHSYRRGELVQPTPRLLEQPDPTSTRIDTLSSIVTSLLLAGNAYCLLGDRDSLGYPQTAIPLNPDVVSVRTTQTGAIEYQVNGVAVPFDDIMHVRGMTLPGAMQGLGVVTATRRSLGIAIAGDEMAADFYTTGAVPTGVLQADSELTREEASDLKSAFVAAHGGRQRSPAVLSAGIKYQALQLSPKDLEFVQARVNSAREVTTMFKVPSHMVNVPSEGGSMTYQNVQQDSINFVRFCLRGWYSRVEQAFTQELPRGQVARLNIDALIRGSRSERFNAHKTALEGGWLTVDEIRDLENVTASVAHDDLLG